MGTVTARVVVCAALLASGMATVAPTSHLQAAAQESLAPSIPTQRVAGADRYATAAKVSRTFFEAADTVYVATGRNFADALAGGPRAVRDGAPILLVTTESVPEVTANELRRLKPERIVVLGGTAAVSDDVRKQLREVAPVRRLAGPDRFATAMQISADAFPRGSDDAYVATGRNFPDALTGGVSAGIVGAPVLLSEKESPPPVTRNELARLSPAATAILGGDAAVSDEVATRLDLAVPDGNMRRLAGPDRYATAVRLSRDTHHDGLAVDTVFLATGANFPDALAAAPAIVREQGALLLTQTNCVPVDVRAEIARLAPSRIVILGGSSAISEAAAALTPCDELPPLPTFTVVPRASERSLPAIGDSGPRPVAAMTSASGTTEFVANEALVRTDDDQALNAFLARHGGTVLQTSPGFGDLPATHLVRLSKAPSARSVEQVGANLQWLNWHATGDHALSSRRARDSMVATVDGLVSGLAVSLNFVDAMDGDSREDLLNRQIAESQHKDVAEDDRNPFKWGQFSDKVAPFIGTAEAWRLLALAEDDDRTVQIAIIDRGFAATNGDYPPGVTGNTGERSDGKCGDDPCPWHGTNVAIAAAGEINDGFGSVGSAGPVGRLTLHDRGADPTTFGLIANIAVAVAGGADIINMSFGGWVDAVFTPVLWPQEQATAIARDLGVHLFASAGNEHKDVDAEDCFVKCWEEQWKWPCENDGVICVGGLAKESLGKHPKSAYGRESCGNPNCQVEIFAPFTVLVGEDPDHTGDQLREVHGTSLSSPYVAGVMALIKATGLSGAYTREQALLSTAQESPDRNVGRVVNAYEAVRVAYAHQGVEVDREQFRVGPPAAGFATSLGDDQGTYLGKGSGPTDPRLAWVSQLPSHGRDDRPLVDYPAPTVLHHAAELALIQPQRRLPDGSTVNELVAVDTTTGQVAWSVPGVMACPVAVDGDGRIWGLLEREQEGTIDALISIKAETGVVRRHATTVPVLPDLGFAGNVCEDFPLRLSTDGQRLLMSIRAFWDGNWRPLLVVWDIGRPTARLRTVVRLDESTDPGQGAGWELDVRVAPAGSPGAGSIYLFEQTAGDDPDSPFDNEYRIHAVTLSQLPRGTVSIVDTGVISRSVALGVARVGAGAITVLDDSIYVSGAEEQGLYTRDPAHGDQVTSRNFRITDDGSTLRITRRSLGRTPEARQAGDHGPGYRQLSAGDGRTLVGLAGSPGVVAGMDASSLKQTFERSEFFCHGNTGAADSNGLLYIAEDCEREIHAIGPNGAVSRQFDTSGMQPLLDGNGGFDLSTLTGFRVEAVAPDGTLIVTARSAEETAQHFYGMAILAIR